MAIPLATAFVRLRPDPDRDAFRRAGEQMGAEAGRGAARGMDRDRNIDQAGDRAGRRAAASFSKGFERNGGGTFARVAATAAARATLFGSAAAAAAPGVIHLTAALAPAAGAIAGLPIAMAGFQAASATFRVATAGVGDAITKGLTGTSKQAEKALKELPPAARTFATSIIALKKPLNDIRATVAQRFFTPLMNEVKPLAELYLPMLKTRMGDLAGPLGGLGEQIAQTARRGVLFTAVQRVFDQTATAVVNLRGAIDPLGRALGAVLSSTARLLPGMAQGFTNLAARFAAWVTEAARSGQLVQLWNNAMTTLRTLGAIAGNVGSILGSVFRAATANGGDLLTTIRNVTAQVAAFLKTAEGAGALQAVFRTLSQLGAALRTSLGAVLPAIAQSIGTLGPVIAQLATVAARFIVALAPLLPTLARVAAVIATALLPVLNAVAGWLERNQGLIVALAPAITGLVIGFKAWGLATTVLIPAIRALFLLLRANPIGLVITAIALMVTWTIHLWKTNEDFRRQVTAVWNAVQWVVGKVSSWWTGTIMPSIQRAIQQGIAAWQNFRTSVSIVWQALKQTISIYWGIIRTVFMAIRSTLQIIGTAFRTFGTLAGIVWRTFGAGVKAVWTSIRTGSFDPLKKFIRETLPGAFRTGVQAIGRAWSAVQNAARKPVVFVVDHVINPLIRGYNKIAKVFNAPTADYIHLGAAQPVGNFAAASRAGLARGGQIPGMPSNKDNRMATILGAGNKAMGNIAVATGEFVTNTRSTMANLPLIKAINRKRGKVTRGDVDPYLEDAPGGQGDGIGDYLGKVWSGLQGIGSFIANPVAGIKKVFRSVLDRIPGGGSIVPMLRGMGGHLMNGIAKFLGTVGGGAIGGEFKGRGWQAQMAYLRRRFPGLRLISGLRPGSRTLSGNLSYHASGRAVDVPAIRAVAQYIKSTVGRNALELITPWRDMNLLRGKPHRYSPAIERQHGVGSAGNDHIHWAAAMGGLVTKLSGIADKLAGVGPMPVRLFDNGGAWPSGTLGANLSGRTEYVSTGRGGGGIVVNIYGPVGSAREAENLVVKGYRSARRKKYLP